jgi:hypothetical protein
MSSSLLPPTAFNRRASTLGRTSAGSQQPNRRLAAAFRSPTSIPLFRRAPRQGQRSRPTTSVHNAATRTRSVLAFFPDLSRVVRGDQRPTPVVRILNATPDLPPALHSPSGISAPLGSKCSCRLPTRKLTSPPRPISLRSPAAFFLSIKPPDHRSGSVGIAFGTRTRRVGVRQEP